MTDNSKDEFAKAFQGVDATRAPLGAQAIIDNAEKIRNEIDSDETKDLVNRRTGKWYEIRDGELREVKHGNDL